MAKLKNIDAPDGWLIDPHNKWAIHFGFKNVSKNSIEADCTIDMWGVDSDGKPITFKSRRKATKNDSLKTWNQLLSTNWRKVDYEKKKSA
tara:strand:+ start:101 stop:370 length:270 start_codon:yes stop_codon:yes gene_type:complete